ncbi:PPOX class F420-dependent oxidoreductase [Spongiactinospora sp. TRM90649]|uniref:PPOX class F420-dependent oxidoreductase n=1 Tax=Spongiactinospora sp. TRM90649 TaxID=3031114 RepID=UPI0023F83BC2|nr:PPOX class F420-dependent oxidoreductase [Spongiactinospora sp. TRM90649]MDF5754020.1 PPOX class F420-dependent oxidoreductase [Spongiactinospora sp. TRM90649]
MSTTKTSTKTTQGLDHLAGARTVLLTTFRKDGTPVGTPVVTAIHDGVLYASTLENSGKVKRIRRDARVTVGPCTLRGAPTGPAVEARARVLDGAESRRANRLTESANWINRPIHLYERLIRRRRVIGIEMTVTGAPESADS